MESIPLQVYLPRCKHNAEKPTYFRIKGNTKLFFVDVKEVTDDGLITVKLSDSATIDEVIQTLCSLVGRSKFIELLYKKTYHSRRFKGIRTLVDGIEILVNYSNCNTPYDIKQRWMVVKRNSQQDKTA